MPPAAPSRSTGSTLLAAPPLPRLGVTISFIIVAAAVAVSMLVTEAAFARRTRANTSALLASFARGHANTLETNVRERFADTRLLTASEEPLALMRESASGSEREAALRKFRRRLQLAATAYGYHNLELVDRDLGVVTFLVHDESRTPAVRTALARTIETRTQQLVPLSFDSEGVLEYGFTAPVFADADSTRETIGALYLAMRADSRLLQDLTSNVVEGGSTDVTLIQAERDSAWVFSSSLAQGSMATRGVHIPLADTAYIPSQAFRRGGPAALSGLDIRGVPVRAFVVPIAGTPWFIAAKIDVDEAELRIRAARVGGAIIFLLLLASAAMLGRTLWLQRRREFEAM